MRKSQASQRLSQPTQRLSQVSQGTPRSQPPPMSTGELKEAARAAVRYLLMNDFDKVPIKHSEIVRNVTKNVSRNTNQVLELASKMLHEVRFVEDTESWHYCFFVLLFWSFNSCLFFPHLDLWY